MNDPCKNMAEGVYIHETPDPDHMMIVRRKRIDHGGLVGVRFTSWLIATIQKDDVLNMLPAEEAVALRQLDAEGLAFPAAFELRVLPISAEDGTPKLPSEVIQEQEAVS